MEDARMHNRNGARLLRDTLLTWGEHCRALAAREKQLKACCQEVVLTSAYAPEHRNICHVCGATSGKTGEKFSPHCIQKTHVGGSMGEEFFSAAVGGSSCDELNAFLPAPALVDYCCHLPQKSGLVSQILQNSERRCDNKCLKKKDPSKDLPSQEGCRRLRLARVLRYLLPDPSSQLLSQKLEEKPDRGFYGLGCEGNKTLRFVAVDSRRYSWIGDRIGEEGLPGTSKVAIVDNETESQFILTKKLTVGTLRAFIRDFSNGQLVYARNSERKTNPDSLPIQRKRTVTMEKVTSKSFRTTVLDSDKDVLLFYTGGVWCGFCSSASHIILAVASYFSDQRDKLLFAKYVLLLQTFRYRPCKSVMFKPDDSCSCK